MKWNLILLAALVLVVTFGAGFFFGYFSRDRQIARVPEQMRARTPDAPAEKVPTDEKGDPLPAAKLPVDPEPVNRTILPPLPNLRKGDIQDTFHQARGSDRIHEATDILAPRGTPVYAVVDGTIERLFLSKQGGNTIYQFDEAKEYSYYYAHLDNYAEGLKEGMKVRRGATIGYVGTTGNAPHDTPHLHFAIFRLGPDKRWWEGVPINPYPLLLRALQVY